MKREKQNKIALWIIFAIVILFVINYLGLFKLSVTQEPRIIRESSQTFSPYICSSEADICQVKGRMFCNIGSNSTSRVIARTDDGIWDDKDGWIITYNPTSGGFDKWCWRSNGVRTGVSTNNPISLPYDTIGYLSSADYTCRNEICIMIPYRNGYVAYDEGTCSGQQLSQTPLYNCTGRELCSGTREMYSCSAELIVDGEKKPNLVYSRNIPGYVDSSTFSINPLEKFELLGGDSINISFTEIEYVETCPEGKKICQSGNVYVCRSNEYVLDETCSYGCNNGKCIKPFDSIQVSITDEDGNNMNGKSFNRNEPVKLSIKLNTNQNIQGTYDLIIMKDSATVGTEADRFSNNQIITNQWTQFFIPEGYFDEANYYVLISYTINNNQDIYGDDSGEVNYFSVAIDFDAAFDVYQTLGTVDNRKDGYTNHPVTIKFSFLQGTDNILPPSNDVTVTYEIGGQTNELQVVSQTENSYSYSFTPIIAGTYTIKGEAKVGTHIENKIATFKIEEESILIDNIKLKYNPVKVGQFYQPILTFETKNRNQELISTANIVKVIKGGTQHQELIPGGSNGVYSVDYTFDEENDYYFVISSSAQGISSNEDTTPQINAGKKEDVFCKTNSECGFLGRCDNGACKTRVDFLIIGAIVIFGFVLIGFLVYRFIKSKRQPSLGGL